MVLVKTRLAQEGSTFDIDPSWLPMLYGRYPMTLPIRNYAAAEELVKHLRQEAKKDIMLKKIKKSATLDAFHTGMPFKLWHEHVVGGARPRSQIDINMEKDFAASLTNLNLKYNVARAARWLYMTALYDNIIEQEAERLASIGFEGFSVEDAKGYLFLETYLYQ